MDQPQLIADTELADGIKKLGLVNLFARCFRKERRSDAEQIAGILCALIVRPLLKFSMSGKVSMNAASQTDLGPVYIFEHAP